METYDPNIRDSTHSVEIVLMQWGYTATFIEKVHGNCSGFTILDAAVESVVGSIPEVDGVIQLTLKNKDGEELICDADDDDDLEEWVKDMVVSCRIIKREKEES